MNSYDFETKATYRWRVWRALVEMCGASVANAVVAYLDTPDGLETRFLVSRGFKPSNLWAINRSAAKIAWTTMRLREDGIDGVNTIGLDALEAAEIRLPKLDAMNFDGMSNVSDANVTYLSKFMAAIKAKSVALTVLAAREPKRDLMSSFRRVCATHNRSGIRTSRTSYGTEVSASDVERVALLGYFSLTQVLGLDGRVVGAEEWSTYNEPTTKRCIAHIRDARWDRYISAAGQPMIWVAMKLVSHGADTPHRPLPIKDVKRLLRMGLMPRFCASFDGAEGIGSELDRLRFKSEQPVGQSAAVPASSVASLPEFNQRV